MPAKSYNQADVILTVGGVPISGFADGDAISFESDDDLWTKTTGTDGEVVRSYQNKNGGKITCRLLYGMASNQYLSGLMDADRLTGLGAVPIGLTDIRSGTTFFAEAGWIMTRPSVTYARDVGEIEWVIDMDTVSTNYGLLLA